MKKTLFTICSIALVCCAIIMSCSKDDYNGTQVGYASQPGYGGGNNPNPNGLPYQTPTVTPTTPPPTPKDSAGSFSINGATALALKDNGNNSTGYYTIYGAPASGVSYPDLSITFSTTSPPASGQYTITSIFPPTAGQCNFGFNDAGGNPGNATTGMVTVSVGSPNSVCSFSNIICTCSSTTYTLSGSLHYF